jgi:hypothetical protein
MLPAICKMKFLSTVSILLFATLFANGQGLPARTIIYKVYPLAPLKDEFRVGLEKETKKGKSIEVGAGYLYRTFERNNCRECYYMLPGYFSAYTGQGASLRINWNEYSDNTRDLSGFYTSIGLGYKFMVLDEPDHFPSGPKLPYRYYYSKQHAVYVQGLIGKQFTKNRFVSGIYGGLSIYGQLNYFKFFGTPAYAFEDHLKKNPAFNMGGSLNLGMYLGYKDNKRPKF